MPREEFWALSLTGWEWVGVRVAGTSTWVFYSSKAQFPRAALMSLCRRLGNLHSAGH